MDEVVWPTTDASFRTSPPDVAIDEGRGMSSSLTDSEEDGIEREYEEERKKDSWG